MDLCDCSYMLNAIIMLSLIFLFTFFAWKSTYVPIKTSLLCIELPSVDQLPSRTSPNANAGSTTSASTSSAGNPVATTSTDAPTELNNDPNKENNGPNNAHASPNRDNAAPPTALPHDVIDCPHNMNYAGSRYNPPNSDNSDEDDSDDVDGAVEPQIAVRVLIDRHATVRSFVSTINLTLEMVNTRRQLDHLITEDASNTYTLEYMNGNKIYFELKYDPSIGISTRLLPHNGVINLSHVGLPEINMDTISNH